MPSRSARRGAKALLFLQRRLPFIVLVVAVLGVALIAWRLTASISAYEEEAPAGVEQVVDGRFLGLKVYDNTSDKIMQNSFLRLAMNEGFRSADVVRRHQMDEIWLQDGQHPESGDPAVIVVVKPKPHEVPRPPFEPIGVRRWRPEEGKVYNAEDLARRQRNRTPDMEDLAQIRHIFSGHRFTEVNSLFRSVRRLLVYVVFGLALVLMAGIYRSYAWFSTRSDTAAERSRSDGALRGFKAAASARRAAEQLDQPGY